MQTAEKLRGLGLNVDFLYWLEGEEDRLPRTRLIYQVRDHEFVAALRAANWLGQFWSAPDAIGPVSPEAWKRRYELLEGFLCEALTMSASPVTLPSDLVILEEVLEKLLARNAREPYRRDIFKLRSLGIPDSFSDVSPKPLPSGKAESEQTQRMRVAVHYIEKVSRWPYADLANLWTEHGAGPKTYQPDEIRNRLRKGPDAHRSKGWLENNLAHWQRVYAGDRRTAFPVEPPMG